MFSEFDTSFSSYEQEQKEKLYHKIKHIYIESVMYGNDTMKYEALIRLIDGAKELEYDFAFYEKELNDLVGLYPNMFYDRLQNEQNSTTDPSDTLLDTSLVYAGDVVKLEEVEEYVSVINNSSINQTAQVIQSVPPVDSSSSTPKLTAIKQDKEKVVFTFDETLGSIKFFTLKGDSFRYIYDIKAIKANVTVNFKIEGIKDFRISQFDKGILRIVFEHSKEMNINQSADGKNLIFSAREFMGAKAPQNTSVKTTPPKKIDNNTSVSNIAPIKTQNNTTITNITPIKDVLLPQKTIVIDAGHGGKDSGAVSDKKLEKEAVLKIALLLGVELKKRGYKVYQTRTKDIYLKLQERTKVANDNNADIFVSIHANAAPKNSGGNWQGIETFFLSPTDSRRSKNAAELENQSDVEEMNFYSKQTFLNFLNREKIIASHKLAIDIQQYILTSLKKSYIKIVDGGVREAPFWVLTGAQMPAVLLEVGYITDKTDRDRMFSENFQQIFVRGIADGIDSYFVKNR